MALVSPIIERATQYIQDSVYMRATDINANMDISSLDLHDKILVLYNNLPTIKHKVGNSVQREYPIEIKILKLSRIDDNDEDGDIIRAELLPHADLLFDAITKDFEVSKSKFTENYEIDFLGVVNIYDDVLTGVNLKFNIYIDRTYFCVV